MHCDRAKTKVNKTSFLPEGIPRLGVLRGGEGETDNEELIITPYVLHK